jgi:hypothetical protein
MLFKPLHGKELHKVDSLNLSSDLHNVIQGVLGGIVNILGSMVVGTVPTK